MNMIMMYIKYPRFLITSIKCRIFGHDPFKKSDGSIELRGAFCKRCGEVLPHLEDPNDHCIKLIVPAERVRIHKIGDE